MRVDVRRFEMFRTRTYSFLRRHDDAKSSLFSRPIQSLIHYFQFWIFGVVLNQVGGGDFFKNAKRQEAVQSDKKVAEKHSNKQQNKIIETRLLRQTPASTYCRLQYIKASKLWLDTSIKVSPRRKEGIFSRDIAKDSEYGNNLPPKQRNGPQSCPPWHHTGHPGVLWLTANLKALDPRRRPRLWIW